MPITLASTAPSLDDVRVLLREGRIRAAAATLAAVEADEGATVASTAMAVGFRLAAGDVAGALSRGQALEPGETIESTLALADLAAARGDHERALVLYRAAGELPEADHPWTQPWRAGAAIALVFSGARTAAADLARENLAVAEGTGGPTLLGIALRTLATADVSVDALGALDRAHALAVGDRRLAAQIDADLAGLLLLTSPARRAEAVTLLRGAETYAAREGLWPLHQRILRLLERSGHIPTPPAADLERLSAVELRTARLAARGHTNREIADALVVTVKSVEWNLSRVYRKLGVASRVDLGEIV